MLTPTHASRVFFAPFGGSPLAAQRGEGAGMVRLTRWRVPMAVHGEVKGDKLILTIDMSEAARKAAQPSKSGKTVILATTSGFTRFGDVAVSLNATLPAPTK